MTEVGNETKTVIGTKKWGFVVIKPNFIGLRPLELLLFVCLLCFVLFCFVFCERSVEEFGCLG